MATKVLERTAKAKSKVGTPAYDELFAGDPTWVTESIAGMGDDGRPLVTKTSFRFLQTLYNLGPAPEPNLTIWYSPELPEGFRRFSSKVAIDTSSISTGPALKRLPRGTTLISISGAPGSLARLASISAAVNGVA